MTEPVTPLRVDLGRVAAVGSAAWAVALLVTVVLAATRTTDWLPAAVCATGALLGLAGVAWSRRHDAMGRRLSR